MSSLLQDLRYALRSLVKSPAFAATAVLTLALGIGANSAIFSVVYSVLLRPLPYENPNELVRFGDVQHGRSLNSSYVNVNDWRKTAQSFASVAMFNPISSVTLTSGGQAEVLSASFVEAEMFRLLRVQPVHGRIFTADEEKPGAACTALISHRLWQGRFGGEASIAGSTVNFSGGPCTVVGILPADFRLAPQDVWLPLGVYVRPVWLQRANHGGFQALGRLKPGVSVAQAQAEMTQIMRALEAAYPAENRALTTNVTLLQHAQTRNLRPTILLLLGAVSLVLLIACVNVASLALARNISREREVAIRRALGAGRAQLLRLFLCESGLVALAGGVSGTLLAMWSIDALGAVWRAPYSAGPVQMDGAVLAYSAAMTLATALLFGALPAWQAASGGAGLALRGQGASAEGSMGKQRMRRALVALEVAMCLALLAGAGAMMRTFDQLAQVDPGFRAENLLAINIQEPGTLTPPQRIVLHRNIREKFRAVPGVSETAVAWPFSYGGASWTPRVNFVEKPVPDGEERMVEAAAVSPAYFAAMGIALKQGRLFAETDRGTARMVAVVSEEFVRTFWPGENALGRRLRMVGIPEMQDVEVVGVVGSTRRGGAASEVYPEIYCSFEQFGVSGGTLVVRTAGDPGPLIAPLRAALGEVHAQIAVARVSRLTDVLTAMLSDRNIVRLMLGVFAGLALALAAVGIYGVVAFSVAQRAREIGVRMALGARQTSILTLVIRQGLAPVLAGVLVGLAAALGLARFMKALVFGVEPHDPVSLVAAGAVLLLAGLLACYLPARRAAMIDPMIALRQE